MSLSERTPRRWLVTGAAGFIGFHTSRALLERGEEVVGVDNLNPYYDPRLKRSRLAMLEEWDAFTFHELDIADRRAMAVLFRESGFERVVHLAAQAGVRHSLEQPHAYVRANVNGTLNVLEGCRHHPVEHLLFASTSSVYGANGSMPFSVTHGTAHPLTLYAATKKGCEEMVHAYAHLFGIPSTGLRFFTVYGPWGRPDMALFKFTKAMLAGEPIQVYGHGRMSRDFTYVSDIVDGILAAADHPPEPDPDWDAGEADPSGSAAPYRMLNIGAGRPVPLLRFIELIEENLGVKARKEFLPMQLGDVSDSHADVSELTNLTGYTPRVDVEKGVEAFVDWYRDYYLRAPVLGGVKGGGIE